MSTVDLAKEAIEALNEKTGSSVTSISKWIESEKEVRVIPTMIGFENQHFMLLAKRKKFAKIDFFRDLQKVDVSWIPSLPMVSRSDDPHHHFPPIKGHSPSNRHAD
jgi:hypothetical protein